MINKRSVYETTYPHQDYGGYYHGIIIMLLLLLCVS